MTSTGQIANPENTRQLNTSQTFRAQQENGDIALVDRALLNDRIEEDEKEARHVIKRLKASRFFGHARQYSALARKKFSADIWFGQQHALCTYKDPDLPLEGRLNRGLAILQESDPLDQTASSETLGLAGAIYKNKWFSGGQRTNLDRSAELYLRGYEFECKSAAFPPDRYAGINAAYPWANRRPIRSCSIFSLGAL